LMKASVSLVEKIAIRVSSVTLRLRCLSADCDRGMEENILFASTAIDAANCASVHSGCALTSAGAMKFRLSDEELSRLGDFSRSFR